jgi:uncharacterized protein (DUF427 family)
LNGTHLLCSHSSASAEQEDFHQGRGRRQSRPVLLPRNDVKMDALQRTSTSSRCLFKGTASYFALDVKNMHLNDAVWSDEDPYEEHAALKERLALYDDKLPAI